MARPRKTPGGAILPYRAIDAAEWDCFFRLVAANGSIAASIRAAFGPERHSAVIYHALENDPIGLGRRLREAQESFRGLLAAEMARRAVVGVDKPQFYKGEVVGYVRETSDTLLIHLMRQADKSFIDKRTQAEVVTHNGDAAFDFFSMSYEQAERLPRDMRKNLISILRWVEADNATGIADGKLIEAQAEVAEGAEAGDPYDVQEAEALW